MQIQKEVLIDISEDANNSSAAQCGGLLLSGIVFPAAMTGTAVTFDFSFDGSTWYDVKETDGSDVSYTVSAGDVVVSKSVKEAGNFFTHEIIKFINENNQAVKVNVKLNKEVPGMRYIKN